MELPVFDCFGPQEKKVTSCGCTQCVRGAGGRFRSPPPVPTPPCRQPERRLGVAGAAEMPEGCRFGPPLSAGPAPPGQSKAWGQKGVAGGASQLSKNLSTGPTISWRELTAGRCPSSVGLGDLAFVGGPGPRGPRGVPPRSRVSEIRGRAQSERGPARQTPWKEGPYFIPASFLPGPLLPGLGSFRFPEQQPPSTG